MTKERFLSLQGDARYSSFGQSQVGRLIASNSGSSFSLKPR